MSVYSQGYDTAAGGDSTDTSGGGQQQSFDGSDNKSAANGDNAFSGSNDFSGGNSNNDGGFQDYSSNDSNNSSFGEYVSETFGLGNEAGVESNPGGPAPLSNQNHTIDSAGATASTESTDEGYECTNTNCNSPTLTGYTYCIANQPVIRLDWTMDVTNVNYWHVVKAKEPSPQFTQLTSQPVSHQFYFVDNDLLPNDVYYYGVFGSNSGNGAGYSSRTPLSNIFAVYTPSCAPVVAASCPIPGVVQRFNVSWNNNDPTATGYMLYRGTGGDVATRTFLPPKHSASTAFYEDSSLSEGTTYNYWLTSYKTVVTPAWTEVTSSDGNGNPTGFIDHPQTSNDVETQYSGMSTGLAPAMCSSVAPSIAPSSAPSQPPPTIVLPSISLSFTTPEGTFLAGDLPVVVREGTLVTLNWQILNATSAQANTTPSLASWSGAINPVSGLQTITTTTSGNYVLNLTAFSPSGSTQTSIQLNVTPITNPYFQTTGGDVHTNETIYITPP